MTDPVESLDDYLLSEQPSPMGPPEAGTIHRAAFRLTEHLPDVEPIDDLLAAFRRHHAEPHPHNRVLQFSIGLLAAVLAGMVILATSNCLRDLL